MSTVAGMRRTVVERSARRPAGFALIELMIALVVLSVGILVLAGLMPLGTKKMASSAARTRASELAATCAERLLSTPYADDDLTAGTHTDAANPYPGNFYVSWVVEDDQPITACKRITVYTHWPTAASSLVTRLVFLTPQTGG